MGLPPKGDPARTVAIAVGYLWVVGIITLGAYLSLFLYVGWLTGDLLQASLSLTVLSMFFVVPGVLYITGAIFLKRGITWAVHIAVWPAIVQLVLALIVLLIAFIAFEMGSAAPRPNWFLTIIFVSIALAVVAIYFGFIVALGDAYRVVKAQRRTPAQGFQPIVPGSDDL